MCSSPDHEPNFLLPHSLRLQRPRLKNEASPVPDYVVHPGVPRTLRARFTYFF
jgi:hypothetical protein